MRRRRAEAAAAAAAKEEQRKRDEEARKLAMIDERRAKPLQLRNINFLNTTKTGTALSGATDSFNVSKVLFVGWQVSFDNRLYKLEPGQYRVDAAYIGPDGRTLGSVDDYQPVSTEHEDGDVQRTRRQLARRRVSAGHLHGQLLFERAIFRREEIRGRRRRRRQSVRDVSGYRAARSAARWAAAARRRRRAAACSGR